ncbi:MAG: galactokinase [Acidobacteria bacterium]|nr:galactokinase [Acidobacteriota bacterium]
MLSRLVSEFHRRFGNQPRLFRAPGRVNLIGEHTDYNGGFVFPAAIDLATYVAIAPRADRRLHAESLSFPETLDTPIDQWRQPAGNWTDYVLGVATLLDIQTGADLLIATEVPIGGGLSSSAALEVATALALGAGNRPRAEIARLCQRAENEFTGMQCGIMDPFTSCLGEEGRALLIDCRDLTYRAVSIPPGIRLVIANTMVKHELAASAYNDRRAACESAASRLGVAYLRDIDYSSLAGTELRCARHVISENARVLQFEQALLAGDLHQAGEQMYTSHESLRTDFEVSCEELDTMVAIARTLPGVYGARMTGGGFGGCTINLAAADSVDAATGELRSRYAAATGIDPHIFVCRPAAGASEMTA